MEIKKELKQSDNADRLILIAKGQLNRALKLNMSLNKSSKIIWQAFLNHQNGKCFVIKKPSKGKRIKLIKKESKRFSELYLLMLALEKGGYFNSIKDLCDSLFDLAVSLSNHILKKSKGYPYKKGINALVWISGKKLRQETIVMSEIFQKHNLIDYEEKMLQISGEVTTSMMSHYADAVGESMVRMAEFYERNNKTEKACEYYYPYILDANWIIEELKGELEMTEEESWVLMFFHRSCEGYLRCGGSKKRKKIKNYLIQCNEIISVFEEE